MATQIATAQEIRKIIKANYPKFFAVQKMKWQNCDINYSVSNSNCDDFGFLVPILEANGIKAECIGLNNYLKVYGRKI